MPITKLREFLDKQQIKYVNISHSKAFTSQEVAESAHISGWELAKTVIVKLDDTMAMAVLPASLKIDLDLLKQVTGATVVALATEEEFRATFPECETGAMPPFGTLYQMNTFVDQRLREDEQIAFNAGTHTELVKMSFGDFERLVNPIAANFSISPHTAATVASA